MFSIVPDKDRLSALEITSKALRKSSLVRKHMVIFLFMALNCLTLLDVQ